MKFRGEGRCLNKNANLKTQKLYARIGVKRRGDIEKKRRGSKMQKEHKTVSLVGKCGRCGRQFFAEAELPLITFEDDEGNEYKGVVAPHLVTLCPFCFGLLNLAKRVETNKKREA